MLAASALLWLYACGSHSSVPTEPKDTIKPQVPARAETPASPVERMPDFNLKDTSGRNVSSAQFRGKILLIDFWATWCGPCKKEMPGYEDLYRRYKARGLM